MHSQQINRVAASRSPSVWINEGKIMMATNLTNLLQLQPVKQENKTLNLQRFGM